MANNILPITTNSNNYREIFVSQQRQIQFESEPNNFNILYYYVTNIMLGQIIDFKS